MIHYFGLVSHIKSQKNTWKSVDVTWQTVRKFKVNFHTVLKLVFSFSWTGTAIRYLTVYFFFNLNSSTCMLVHKLMQTPARNQGNNMMQVQHSELKMKANFCNSALNKTAWKLKSNRRKIFFPFAVEKKWFCTSSVSDLCLSQWVFFPGIFLRSKDKLYLGICFSRSHCHD